MHGRPPYDTLYGRPNDPTLLLHGVFAEIPFKHMGGEGFIRDGSDAVLRALREAGAEEVPPETFRLRGGSLGMDLPLRDSDYRVWALKKRNTCSRSHGWQVALRVGDPPRGILATNIKNVG